MPATVEDARLTPEQREFLEGQFPLAVRMAGLLQRRVPRMRRDDVVSACCVGMVRAVRTYDPARGLAWTTYAKWWMLNVLLREARRDRLVPVPEYHWRADPKEEGHRRLYSADAERTAAVGSIHEAYHPAAGDEPAAVSLTRAETVARVREAIALLPERYATIVRRHDLEGASFPEIADELGVTKQAAWKGHSRAMEKLEGILLDLGLGREDVA